MTHQNVKSNALEGKNWLTLEICGRRLIELVSEGAPVVGIASMRSLRGVAQGVTVALSCNKNTHQFNIFLAPWNRLLKFKCVHFFIPRFVRKKCNVIYFT